MCRPNVEFAVTCESVTAQCVRQLASALWKADYSQYNSLSLRADYPAVITWIVEKLKPGVRFCLP